MYFITHINLTLVGSTVTLSAFIWQELLLRDIHIHLTVIDPPVLATSVGRFLNLLPKRCTQKQFSNHLPEVDINDAVQDEVYSKVQSLQGIADRNSQAVSHHYMEWEFLDEGFPKFEHFSGDHKYDVEHDNYGER